MGAWDFGPFENDDAADFGGRLDGLADADRPAALRAALQEAVACTGYLDSDIGAAAIAAAALIARELADGARFVSPHYGPKKPLPVLPDDLRPLAVSAIDRVMGEDSELAEEWGDGGQQSAWHRITLELREALTPAS
ncbi:DUF4259 domain-containing protein [Catenulispora subtropica]|uniref:DUF4259 domain-containing protein n=1 Tax=Catenulispora subtropica TaxID=450798 RepID=A0ABN2STD4_9ACTN